MSFVAISVILPFRDAAATIDEAIASVLSGGEADVELLAIDDGSCDDGVARVSSWEQRDSRVRLLRTPGRGLIAALQTGLAHSQATYVARMDSDDRSAPDRLSRQRAFLERNPHIGAVGARVVPFCDEGQVGEGLSRYVDWQNGLLEPAQHRRELFVEAPLCHPSVMMRRSAVMQAGGYQDDGGPEDYGLWLRLDAAGFGLAKLPEVLLWWRHRAGRATFSDARYSLERIRQTKAPFLARRVLGSGKTRRVLWGAGPTGRRLARELEGHGLGFDLFVDIDPRKIGGQARGAPIAAIDALDPKKDVVVAAVGARGARALIRPDLIRRGFEEGIDFWFAA